jgi:hypothetical protein
MSLPFLSFKCFINFLYRIGDAILEDQTISDESRYIVYAYPIMINEAIENLRHSYFLTSFDQDQQVKKKLKSMYTTGS